ncbi:uncharacterized protein G2W53_019375 [Senna tora]|uniref:Uncharacterized protein n=1 Tax=Senna tora TaxID=362788 RepID=A0A834TWU8_9FABA|nr:uncharacterized protein G2W53_019375 [Senna tora]
MHTLVWLDAVGLAFGGSGGRGYEFRERERERLCRQVRSPKRKWNIYSDAAGSRLLSLPLPHLPSRRSKSPSQLRLRG